MPQNHECKVNDIQIKREMAYNHVTVLQFTIQYPQLECPYYPQPILREINLYYEQKAKAFQQYCENVLYKMALDQYQYGIAGGIPVHPYEAKLNYNITFNQEGIISLYFDQYEFTGGAHGSTKRSSDTWNLNTGRKYQLSHLFPGNVNYKEDIIKNINTQIARQMAAGTHMYFDNYQELVAATFNEDNFYLSPDGTIVYFQEYDIAPYAAGIVTFTIPLQ